MAESFLIIEQIENHIRKLLDQKFTPDELSFLLTSEENPKAINILSDLSFGQYVRILEDPKRFSKLNLNIDRCIIVKHLEEVRKIRNDVMHFDPDGITLQNLELLRQIASFFHILTTTIKTKR